MTNIQNPKHPYDLEERTFIFARDVRNFIKTLPKSSANYEDGKQLIKSSGSVGANFREVNEALRIKISRKEAKESEYCHLNIFQIEQ